MMATTNGEPYFNAGSLGLLKVSAATSKINQTASKSTPSMDMSSMKEPSLDEIFPRRSKLELMRQEKEECEEITQLMAEDLMLAQEEVRQKDVELARMASEQVKLEEELEIWKEKIKELSIELQEEKRLAKESIEMGAKQSEDLSGQIADQEHLVAEERDTNTELRAQIEQLTISANEYEAEKRRVVDQVEYEHNVLQNQITQLRSDLDERESQVALNQALLCGSEVTNQNLEKRAQEAEASLQELSNRIAIEADRNHSQLRERISELEGKLQDQRQQTEWFKKNSERLSAEIKEDSKKRKVAEQEERAVRSERDDWIEEVGMLSRHGQAIPTPASSASTYPADAPPASSLSSTSAPQHEDVQLRSLVQQQEDVIQQPQPSNTPLQQPQQTPLKSSPVNTPASGRSSISCSNTPPAPKPCTCDRCKETFPSVNAFRRHLRTCVLPKIGPPKSNSMKSPPKPNMKS